MKIIENFLNLIYPPVCGFCNQICEESLCKKCKIKIKKYEINSIRKVKDKYFDELLCLFRYEDVIRDILIKYKFQNKAYLYKTFSKIILKNKKIYSFLKKYDIIIPVPISKKRNIQRGYNQSYLIAKEIATNSNLKCENKCLVKQKDTIEQSKLNKNQREINVKDVYRLINKEKILNKKILLIDDIYTTGNTVNECARELKKLGIKHIGVLVIAKD
jgi:ComF family protein